MFLCTFQLPNVYSVYQKLCATDRIYYLKGIIILVCEHSPAHFPVN